MKEFKQKVYKATSRIPKGKVLTYGLIACLAGSCNASRAAGNALSKNLSPKVPCHRVIRSDGFIGGYRDNTKKKIVRLKSEGISIKKVEVLPGKNRKKPEQKAKIDLNKYCWPTRP
jgi:methylated-DNA-[protein]-cysteine S-methyltransferase